MRYPILTDTEITNHVRTHFPQVMKVETAYLVANGWFMRVMEREGVFSSIWNHEQLAPLSENTSGLSLDKAIRVARAAEGGELPKAPSPPPANPSTDRSDIQAALNMAVRGLLQIAKTPFGSQPIQIAQNALREVEKILGRPVTNESSMTGSGPGPAFVRRDSFNTPPRGDG